MLKHLGNDGMGRGGGILLIRPSPALLPSLQAGLHCLWGQGLRAPSVERIHRNDARECESRFFGWGYQALVCMPAEWSRAILFNRLFFQGHLRQGY